MSVYSYGPQGPDGQGYHSQGNRRADEPFAAPGGSGPVIDMVPARQRKRHPFLYGLVLVALCGAAAYFGTVYANSRTMPEPQNVVVYQAPSGNASVTGARAWMRPVLPRRPAIPWLRSQRNPCRPAAISTNMLPQAQAAV